MGERDLAPEAPARRAWSADHSAAAWGTLALLLAALGIAALFVRAPASDPTAPFVTSPELEPFLHLEIGPVTAFVAALCVAVSAFLAARRLEVRLGKAAPLWVAVFLFASLAFEAVLWTPGAAILMAAAATAFAIAQGGDTASSQKMPDVWDEAGATRGAGGLARWLVVGALLGLIANSHPFYLGLLAPAALAVPTLGRRRAWFALGLGAAAVVAAGIAIGGIDRWLGGIGPIGWDLKLWGWNLLYTFFGRNVGLLPYFLPLLLALGASDDERSRFALALGVLLLAAAFALLRPFDFFGGPSAMGSRFFLPLYGAVWMSAAKPVRAWPAVAVAALAGALLWPVWLRPASGPLDGEGRPLYVRHPLAARLPLELSQRDLPAARVIVHHGLHVRLADPAVWAAANGESLRLGEAEGEVFYAAPYPLGSLLLEFSSGASPQLSIEGGELGETILRPDRGIAYVVTLGKPYATMHAWWSGGAVHWYRLRLRFPDRPAAPIAFSIAPQRKPAR